MTEIAKTAVSLTALIAAASGPAQAQTRVAVQFDSHERRAVPARRP